MRWVEIEELHSRASAEVVRTAESIPTSRWTSPRAEGKWSPAEVIEHLNLTYDILLAELAGGGGMRVRTKWWQRIMLRLTILPKIMRGLPFPKGIRAPREIRPESPQADQSVAIASFKDRSARFAAAITAAQAKNPRTRLTHPYFGKSTLDNALLVCARHLQHHHEQLRDQNR